MPHPFLAITLVILAAAMLTGCERDSALSRDVVRHFERNGIPIEPVKVHQKAWSRSGCVVAEHLPDQVTKIVDSFQLRSIAPGTNEEIGLKFHLQNHSDVKIASWAEAWGLTGRPKAFGLRDGGQFEYFYLVVANDGFVYLLAEYAYG
ncbi:MAG: hypothetical protein ACK553_00520 [Planctomycetota bacterium]